MIKVIIALGISGVVVAGLLLFLRLDQERRGASTQVRPRRVDKSKSTFLKKGDDLQAAIDAAQFGDKIVLQAGASFESPSSSSPRDFGFALPDKGPGTGTDADYITIESSSAGSLPAGVRVSPANAPLMARIVASAAPNAVQLRQGAHHYKFIGIEFTNKDATGIHTNSLIDSQTYIPQGTNPHHVVIDRCYLHPIEETTNPTTIQRSATRGMGIDGIEITLSNSYVVGFGGRYRYGATTELIDSEGFLVVAGPGPYHIVNNYIDAWFANFFLGGGGRPAIAANTGIVQRGATTTSCTLSATNNLNVGDMITFPMSSGENGNGQVLTKTGNTITYTPLIQYSPSANVRNPAPAPAAGVTAAWNGQQINGVEIRRNTFNKDAKFKIPGSGDPKGWFEVKNGNNITIDGNLFQGYPTVMAFTSRNDSGSNPWSTISNLVITNNIVTGYSDGFIFMMKDYASLSAQSHNILVQNNLFMPNPVYTGTYHHAKFAAVYESYNLEILHNTMIGNRSHILTSDTANVGLTLRDNIVNNGEYGLGCLTSPPKLATCWPNLRMDRNVIFDNRSDRAQSLSNPGTQWYPSSTSAIRFVDPANGNYRLSPASPYKDKATDGKDIGVDFDALNRAMSPAGSR
jgi:hypothetical protein